MTLFSIWQTEFDKQVQAATLINNKILVEAAKEFTQRVEARTPVGDPSLWNYPAPAGYQPGTLKASWSLQFSAITQSGAYATVSNDQPYAQRVEFGWSTQAPNGMLRVTIKEWQDIIQSFQNKSIK